MNVGVEALPKNMRRSAIDLGVHHRVYCGYQSGILGLKTNSLNSVVHVQSVARIVVLS